MAGFELSGVALRAQQGEAQIHWHRSSPETLQAVQQPDAQEKENLIQMAALDYLRQRGEPANYLYIHAAVLTALAQEKSLLDKPLRSPADMLSEISQTIHNSLVGDREFHRYGGSTRTLESGRWWLGIDQKGAHQPAAGGSLVDRVEMKVVDHLVKNPTPSLEQLESAICSQLPGLLSPERETIIACLESYGERIAPETSEWRLRPQDQPEARREDIRTIRALLNRHGGNLGYRVKQEGALTSQSETPIHEPLVWLDEDGFPAFVFYVLASAVFGKIVFPIAETRQFISTARKRLVIPGGRAGLIRYKFERDPRLSDATENDWEFIKYRHLRRLSEATHLTRVNIDQQLLLDPLANEDPQLSLL